MPTTKRRVLCGMLLLGMCVLWGCRRVPAAPGAGRVVRLAELEIDPEQLDGYKAALREEIETSVRVEPGVLTLYAVSVKGRPEQIRLFEMYADDAAYRAHLETAHFKKYKAATAGMVRALRLVETDAVVLGSKFE